MSFFRYRVKSNVYRDSIALMQLTAALLAKPGVRQATVMMATPANRAALTESDWPLPADLHPDDLLLAIDGESEAEVESALDWAEAELNRRPAATTSDRQSRRVARTLAEGMHLVPEANLAIISVPGEYAYAEALKALKTGLHVFLFSSGLTIADEVRLKQVAAKRGLLMLGAECGTAILGGIPLGFANVVRPGNIGLVAASGSGLQEVTCLIHNWGGGISHAIGTGGRDLHEQVGAVTMLAGLRLLLDDPDTQVIVLISKPPAAAVAARVLEAATKAAKPVIIAFLGVDEVQIQTARLTPATTLEAAARLAMVRGGHTVPQFLPPPGLKARQPRRYIRGLFAGGTLCTEATLILEGAVGPVIQPTLTEPCPAAHTCLDLGREEYTRGRPHPMIDATLRAEQLHQVATDPDTAVVLFDVILGYGASSDPAGPLLEAISDLKKDDGPLFVAHVCGTEDDPQGMSAQISRLRRAGVIVAPTNAAAARWAGEMIRQ